MMHATVDLTGVSDRAALHERLRGSLPLPPYYGNNLDALFDCLTEPHEAWDVQFVHCDHARTALGAYFDNLRLTFDDAAREGAAVTATWDGEQGT